MKKTDINLVPDIDNPSPDYYCTWQTQLYATSDGKPKAQRAAIGEKGLFGKEKPYGWAYFYKEARRDLILVMDDSWDVPVPEDPLRFGSLKLDPGKFPEATSCADTAEAQRRLSERIRGLGWKGIGGWVCAQEAGEMLTDIEEQEAYWKKRLKDAHHAGILYWKVDWGRKGRSEAFRNMLTTLGRMHAPMLTIEHAMIPEILSHCDVYRTYDVPALMSIPMTMEKLAEISMRVPSGGDGKRLINCEDEAYIAAAGGFSMGIMRHPYQGAFPNGKPDMSFPALHRNLKTKMYEIVRAVRWHRLAPAFDIGYGETRISELRLCDTWNLIDTEAEIEAWWLDHPLIKDSKEGDTIVKSAPHGFARNCDMPLVLPDEKGDMPYVVAARNPNGAYSIASLGRTRERRYWIPRCDITLNVGESRLIAAFGEYGSLNLRTSLFSVSSVWMQDLAGDTAYDVTDRVEWLGDMIRIPGELIKKIGTAVQPDGDTSEPGVVIRLN